MNYTLIVTYIYVTNMLQLVGGFKHDIVIVAAVDPHCQTDPYWL